MDQTIIAADAVISVLGSTSNTPDYLVSEGMKRILTSMQTHSVRRLIVSVGAGVRDPSDAPGGIHLVMGMLVKLLSCHVYEDMRRVDALVRASDTEWTIVCVPMLTDDPPTGKITAAYVGNGSGMRISRADMASFMLAQVEDLGYLHQASAISSQ
jgi:putative NADH-flavin reductase